MVASRNVGAESAIYGDLMALSCLIVDDSAVFLALARELLEQDGITIVGVASTGEDALRAVRELQPDVALVDIDLGGESGLDVVKSLAEQDGGTDLIIISSYAEEEFAELIRASPAVGFVAKAELGADTIDALLAGRRD
jgi:DNA-binding NarL/FixJ family response regulator